MIRFGESFLSRIFLWLRLSPAATNATHATAPKRRHHARRALNIESGMRILQNVLDARAAARTSKVFLRLARLGLVGRVVEERRRLGLVLLCAVANARDRRRKATAVTEWAAWARAQHLLDTIDTLKINAMGAMMTRREISLVREATRAWRNLVLDRQKGRLFLLRMSAIWSRVVRGRGLAKLRAHAFVTSYHDDVATVLNRRARRRVLMQTMSTWHDNARRVLEVRTKLRRALDRASGKRHRSCFLAWRKRSALSQRQRDVLRALVFKKEAKVGLLS